MTRRVSVSKAMRHGRAGAIGPDQWLRERIANERSLGDRGPVGLKLPRARIFPPIFKEREPDLRLLCSMALPSPTTARLDVTAAHDGRPL